MNDDWKVGLDKRLECHACLAHSIVSCVFDLQRYIMSTWTWGTLKKNSDIMVVEECEL